MGHDIHFLERLTERVATSHVELAISLYRAPELVRALLQDQSMPEHAERVAIALEPGPQAPHLVVARDGGFVTCLAAGMSTGDRPIISRAALDTAAGRIARLRERLDLAADLERKGGADRVVDRVFEAAHRLTREEFDAVARYAPILAPEFADLAVDLLRKLRESMVVWSARHELRSVPDRVLAALWKGLHASAHLILLAALGDREQLLREEIVGFKGEPALLSFIAFGHRSGPVLTRWLRAATFVGKRSLASFKQQHAKAITEGSKSRWVNSVPGLVLLGLRHSRLTAEIAKVLGPDRSTPSLPDLRAPGTVAEILARGPRILAEPDAFQELFLGVGRERVAARMARRTGTGAEGGIPDALAALAALDALPDPLTEVGLQMLHASVPVLARAEPRELYAPAEWLDLVSDPYDPAMPRALLEDAHAVHRDGKRVAKTPGRNEPCSCGSGKKFKRCCGG